MRTATIIVMATLTLAFSPSVGGEKRESGQGQETHRSLPASGSWPEQWAERKLHRGEHALVYARKKATAGEALKVLRQVVEEVRQDGVTKPAMGLIVVIDAQEKLRAYRQRRALTTLSRSRTSSGRSKGRKENQILSSG